MYRYDEIDQRLVDELVQQFRDQTRRFLDGKLSEEEFRALRLRNGLYIQRYAPMLRIAIPYGLLSSRQLRKLADIARRYDRGYGHFSTRQNLQLNWPRLEDVPEILAELASVQMHAIQTSGNCVRNITTDHFAGVARDETVDSFVWCELIRQWSTFNPEFSYLPRKFKIAVNGAKEDRALIQAHDIGLDLRRNEAGEIGFRVLVGGGLGRTPFIGAFIRDFLPWQHVLTYLEAIMRVYNRYGRRDNKWKARIKILVKDLTPAGFRDVVEAEWAHLKDGPSTLTQAEVDTLILGCTHYPFLKSVIREVAGKTTLDFILGAGRAEIAHADGDRRIGVTHAGAREEAVAQLAAAQTIVVTKVDRVDERASNRASDAAAYLNPLAAVVNERSEISQDACAHCAPTETSARMPGKNAIR